MQENHLERDPEKRWKWYADAIREDVAGKRIAALRHIFSAVDDLLVGGKSPEIDLWLSAVRPESISVNLIVGIVSITRQASEELPARVKFFYDAWRVIEGRGRNPEKLLGSLRGRRPADGAVSQVIVLG